MKFSIFLLKKEHNVSKRICTLHITHEVSLKIFSFKELLLFTGIKV